MTTAPARTRAPARQHRTPDQEHPASTAVIALLVMIAVLVLTQLYAAIPLIDPVGADLGGDATLFLSTAFSACYAAGFLVWGSLSDQYGRKKILLLGQVLLVTSTVACAFAASLPMLGMLRGLQGLAAASFAPVALAYLSEAVAPARRPTAIGAMSTAFLVAGIFGQVLASTVSLHLNWAWLFLLTAAILLVGLAALSVGMRESARENLSGGLARRFTAIGRVVAKPRVLLLCLAHITLLLSFVAMYTALGPHLDDVGLDASQVIWFRLVGLPGMFASLLVGPLGRRLGTAGVARAGFLTAGLGAAGEAALSESLVGVAVASLVFVTGVALAVPSMITLFGQSAAPNVASGMALNGLVLFLGASIGPLVAGLGLAFPLFLFCLSRLLLVAAASLTGFRFLENRKGGRG